MFIGIIFLGAKQPLTFSLDAFAPEVKVLTHFVSIPQAIQLSVA